MGKRKKWSILVKPTNDCNLNCKYCYDKPLRDRNKGRRMKAEMIDHIAKLASNYAENIYWIWHGGEPTLMGVQWYKDIQEVFYRYYKTRFVQGMQSNGLLLDEEWAKLKRDYDIDIGMSFDVFGQKNIRDGSKNNQSFKEKIEIFKKHGQRLGTISVISRNNYKRQIELYEFYKQNNFSTPAFNHIFKSGGAVENELEVQAEEYTKEFQKYFKYWLHDSSGRVYPERSVSEAFNQVIGSRELCCTYSDCRLNWLGINADGSIYPCDRYVPDRYYLGNIMDFDSIEEVYKTKGFKRYYDDIEKRFKDHCMDCGYWNYCKGGCNGNHISASGSASGVDEFSCTLFRLKFNKVYEVLREVDVYNDKLNRFVLKAVIEHPFITIREIKDFLGKKGYRTDFKYTRDGKELLECEEFKLFRIFNVFKGGTFENPNHRDYIRRNLGISMDLKNIDRNVLKIKKDELMEKIFKDSEEDINRILMGVN